MDFVPDGYWLTRSENEGSTPRFRPIRSGETFTFTTKDPENLPLPSLELLEMQWFLQRLMGTCGAAGWPSLDDDDDDDYTLDNDAACFILKRVREWVGAEEAAGITPEFSTDTPGPSVIECH